MASLPWLAQERGEVAEILMDPAISHTQALRTLNEMGFESSDRAVRRYRKDNGWEAGDRLHTPPREETLGAVAQKGVANITPTGGDFKDVQTDIPLETHDDWRHVFEKFHLNPDEFVVVDDTVRCSTWQQSKRLENGDRDVQQLYSYSARFRRVSKDAISPERMSAWAQILLEDRVPQPQISATLGSTYLILIADPQLGKKGTEEAIGNWTDGVSRHLDQAARLMEEQMVERIHIAFMGDESEGVANNYCVAADTPILTRDMQWVPAGTLRPGDALYAVEEERKDSRGRRFETATVQANEVRDLPAMRIHFDDGTSLVCTDEHPVLARTSPSAAWRWVRARNLSSGLEVAKLADPWSTRNAYDIGWMGGLLDGEGCLQSAAGREPWHLNVSQKPGPVLDRAEFILKEHGFDYRKEMHNSGVAVLHLLGGYAEVLRCLGTFRPVRLLSKIGHPYVRTQSNVRVVSVEDAGVQKIAVMGTSAKTYISNGILSHNTNQPHTIELNLSQQLELDFDMRVWTVKKAAELGLPLSLSSVISNHGEWTRNGSKDPVTTRNDNASTHIARQVKKLFDEIEPFGGPEIDWTIGDNYPGITLNLSGVPCYFSHGYVEKGRGSEPEVRTKNALERQILGRTEDLGDVRLWFMAHYHHFYTREFEGRSLFGCPAIEAEKSSEYMRDQYGVWSPPGVLGLLVGRHIERGWSHLNVF